jgi:lipopolysaccharide biosynthesis regulator YciM
MKCEGCGYENKVVSQICSWCKEWLSIVRTKGGKRR